MVTDRLSAFDSVLETPVAHKGAVLNGLAAFWFDKTRHIIPNHVISLPDPNVTLAKEAEPIRVEMVVRHYLTGSMWRGYQQGQRTFSGVTVPDGLTKHQQFPAAHRNAHHQGGIGPRDYARKSGGEGWVSAELYEQMRVKSLELFNFASAVDGRARHYAGRYQV